MSSWDTVHEASGVEIISPVNLSRTPWGYQQNARPEGPEPRKPPEPCDFRRKLSQDKFLVARWRNGIGRKAGIAAAMHQGGGEMEMWRPGSIDHGIFFR